ncbi:MAG: hypothetical protein HY432_02850 [Candidatus Liptonbacteria bacterium]|nr:hypothetical protein [Candidatus Liptonbacteria bacterium]
MKKLISAVFFWIFNVGVALAQPGGTGETGGTDYTGGTGGGITLTNPLGTSTFQQLVQNILGALFTLSIPIVSIMVMVGGYQILTAAGNEERLKMGRRTITYAVIGFAVILLANGVVSLIRELTGV